VSKYRIELVPSKYKVTIQLLFWAVVLLSPFHWQSQIVPFQWLLQTLFSIVILWLALLNLREHVKSQPLTVDLSSDGEWHELSLVGQYHWRISHKSRISPWFLWIHLVSPINHLQTRWQVVYKDQVSELDYRRICRAILLQQQSKQ
jgi:hypothetical protein